MAGCGQGDESPHNAATRAAHGRGVDVDASFGDILDNLGVLGAYRYIDMDYENDDRSRDFKYEMSISGPALGVVFTF